jgi:DNA-binding transcriptional ArsR family regulator
MKFVAEPGIMLDVLEYNMFFFNHDVMRVRDNVYAGEEASTFLYYNQFRTRKRFADPPMSFLPFFCFRQSYLKFFPLFEYFWNNYDFSSNSSDAFFQSLKSEDFRRFCFNHYLQESLQESEISDVLQGDVRAKLNAIALLSGHEKNLVHFVDFFMNFDALTDELVKSLTACYEKMKAFHKIVIPDIFNAVNSDLQVNEAALRGIHSIDSSVSLKDELYSIHLIEHYSMTLKKYNGNKSYLFFMGASYKNSIDKWGDYGQINIVSFAQAFSNEVKYDIIKELRNGEQTVSQLAKKLYISRSTVDRYLISLYKNLIVTVSKKVGTEIFYQLNPNYIIAAKDKITHELDEIYKDIVPL